MARATVRIKTLLQEWVEVPNLQIEATRRNLLHALAMALCAYLVKDMRHRIFPLDVGKREARRPVKTS